MLETINSLPTIKDRNSPLYGKLDPKFWRYLRRPWSPGFFYDFKDPYNDIVTIIWGPRGGGKTTTAVALSIVDGMMKGIPVISNVPIAWVAKDNTGRCYKVESIPFDIDMFVTGDPILKYKRLLIDEANYQADRLRSTSNNNLSVTDILQQARKFRMSVTFSTINWQWLDPRVTGSLCDLMIECNDLFYKPYGKKHGLKKGQRCTWDIMDQSGKYSGKAFSRLDSRTFESKMFWSTFDTEHFVDPIEARRKRKVYDTKKVLLGPDGEPMEENEWLMSVGNQVLDLASKQPGEWKSKELYDTLGIETIGLRQKVGRYLRDALKIRSRDTMGRTVYDLSNISLAVA